MRFNKKTFTGLIVPEIPIRPQDYIHGDGKLGALGVRVLNPTAKWRDYKAPIQYQSVPGKFESNNCTGFNYCRPVATTLNFMLRNNLLSNRAVEWLTKWGYIKNGSFIFDPHALGIMAGTTSNGNWLQVVADTGRKQGLLPGGTLPPVDGYRDYPSYYDKNLITPGMASMALEFLSFIQLPYQWTTDQATTEHNALTACCLYSAVCTCNGWSTADPVPWCNAGTATNHAVGQSDDQEILDSYDPDIKELSADYNIPFQMMVLAAEMERTMKLVKDNGTVYLMSGVANKKKIGIASEQALEQLFGDEPIEDGDTSSVIQTSTATTDGVIVHKVGPAVGDEIIPEE